VTKNVGGGDADMEGLKRTLLRGYTSSTAESLVPAYDKSSDTARPTGQHSGTPIPALFPTVADRETTTSGSQYKSSDHALSLGNSRYSQHLTEDTGPNSSNAEARPSPPAQVVSLIQLSPKNGNAIGSSSTSRASDLIGLDIRDESNEEAGLDTKFPPLTQNLWEGFTRNDAMVVDEFEEPVNQVSWLILAIGTADRKIAVSSSAVWHPSVCR
jgi:hypothetical protein